MIKKRDFLSEFGKSELPTSWEVWLVAARMRLFMKIPLSTFMKIPLSTFCNKEITLTTKFPDLVTIRWSRYPEVHRDLPWATAWTLLWYNCGFGLTFVDMIYIHCYFGGKHRQSHHWQWHSNGLSKESVSILLFLLKNGEKDLINQSLLKFTKMLQTFL